MNKSKKIRIVYKIIVVIIIAIGAYGLLPDTLADLMKDKVEEGHEYYTVYKTKVNGEYDIRDVKISDPEGIEELWALFEETEVAFKKITRLPGLEDGEVWYEITDMQHIRSIQVEDSGEVQTMAFHIPHFSVIYAIPDEEINEFFERLEEILNIYSDENDNNVLATNSIPQMDIETENGAHITGVVLAHDGNGYPLTEEEFNLLEQGAEPEEILKQRQD